MVAGGAGDPIVIRGTELLPLSAHGCCTSVPTLVSQVRSGCDGVE